MNNCGPFLNLVVAYVALYRYDLVPCSGLDDQTEAAQQRERPSHPVMPSRAGTSLSHSKQVTHVFGTFHKSKKLM
jgi:hypothetical protein